MHKEIISTKSRSEVEAIIKSVVTENLEGLSPYVAGYIAKKFFDSIPLEIVPVDTGRLKESFKPNTISNGVYNPTEDQTYIQDGDFIVVGSGVDYAKYQTVEVMPDDIDEMVVDAAIEGIIEDIIQRV